MKRIVTTAAIFCMAAFGLVVGPLAPAAQAAPISCSTLWQGSGHTDNVRWYHCHWYGEHTARVHICGYSRYLHGVSVTWHARYHRPSVTEAYDHNAHEYFGEGC